MAKQMAWQLSKKTTGHFRRIESTLAITDKNLHWVKSLFLKTVSANSPDQHWIWPPQCCSFQILSVVQQQLLLQQNSAARKWSSCFEQRAPEGYISRSPAPRRHSLHSRSPGSLHSRSPGSYPNDCHSVSLNPVAKLRLPLTEQRHSSQLLYLHDDFNVPQYTGQVLYFQ